MKKLLLGAAAVVASLSLTASVAAAQTGDIDVDRSPEAKVKVDSHDRVKVKVRNSNKVRAYNDTYQKASSGDVKVKGNGQGGDATSGDASNKSKTTITATLNNSTSLGDIACGCDESGVGDINVELSPSAKVKVDSHDKTYVSLYNNNDVKVSNETTQKAYTGDVTVKGNGEAGDATSGDASNEAETSVTLTITN